MLPSQNAGQTPGPFGSLARISKYPYCCEKPRPLLSADASRPDSHLPLSFFLASIRRIPPSSVKGKTPNLGSAKAASPKSPAHGVWAIQRVLGPHGDTLSVSSKSSRNVICNLLKSISLD